VLTHDLLAKAAQPRAHITDHVLYAADEFYTGGVATIAVPCREIQLFVDETLDCLVVGKASTIGVQEGLLNFVPHPRPGEGDRD
jgi:hypothetical protein